jgi:hypothetical protein
VLLGLPGYWRDDNQLKNTLLLLRSQGEIASPNCSIFQAKIADFGLYYLILKEETKNTNSGRTSWFCKFFGLSVTFIDFTYNTTPPGSLGGRGLLVIIWIPIQQMKSISKLFGSGRNSNKIALIKRRTIPT